jgi:putative hydrolase of the HAD superfamily
MIKAILFDFGKVLLNYEAEEIYASLAKKKGITVDEIGKDMAIYYHGAHGGDYATVADFYKTKPVTKITQEELEDISQKIFESTTLNLEVLAIIKELKAKGYALGLLTNFTAALDIFLEKHPEVAPLFNHIFHSYALKMQKPEARFFEHALRTLKCEPAEVIFIDDMSHFVEGAKRVGIHGILFKNASQCREELNRLLAA